MDMGETTAVMIINLHRPATSRAVKPLFARGSRRRPSLLKGVLTVASREVAGMNPGYILGMAGGALLATAAILASTMGLLG